MIEKARKKASNEVEDPSIVGSRDSQAWPFGLSDFEYGFRNRFRGARAFSHEFLDELRHVLVVGIIGRGALVDLALVGVEDFAEGERVDESGLNEADLYIPGPKFIPERLAGSL